MGRQSKIESSKNSVGIIKIILENISSRDASNKIKDIFDENINHTSINNYRKALKKEIKTKAKSKISKKITKKKKTQRPHKNEINKLTNECANKEIEKIETKNTDEKSSTVANIVSNMINISNEYEEYKPDFDNAYQTNHETGLNNNLDVEVAKSNHTARVIIPASREVINFYDEKPDPTNVEVFNLNGFDPDELEIAKQIAQRIAKPKTC